MARDPTDVAVQQTYPELFAHLVAETGYYAGVDDLDDAEHRRIANEVIRRNLGDLHTRALAADGAGIDPSANPAWGAKLASTGATQREAREFAQALYPDIKPEAAVARYNRDLLRASGATVAEPVDRLFDRPF